MAVWSSGLSCQPGTKTLTPAGNFLGPHHGCRLLTQILADSPLPGETRVRLDAQIPVISLSPPGGLSGFSLISEALSLWGLALVMFVFFVGGISLMNTQLHDAVLPGVLSFLGGCCENFLWADTHSQERRIFKKVG